jgi:hypothetical protein
LVPDKVLAERWLREPVLGIWNGDIVETSLDDRFWDLGFDTGNAEANVRS